MSSTNDIMESLPDRFRPKMAGNMQATFQFYLTGEDGGEWILMIDQGTCMVSRGQARDPSATVTMEAADFVGINTGEVNAAETFWSGRIDIKGNLEAVLTLPPVMDWR